MLLDHLPRLTALTLLAGLTALGVAYAGPNDRATAPEEAYKVVLAFEHSLQALPTKEARIDATRKFFDGLPDSATKIEAVGMFDSRYVYVVPKEAAGEILGKLLKDGDVKVRVCAAHALGYLGKGGDHFDALVALLKDVDADGMQDVLYAMGRARDPRFLPYLKAQLNSADPSIRMVAAFELTRYAARDVRGDITALLKDAAPEVRASAIDSLSQLGDDADTPRIREMLGDPSDLVRTRAAVMLAFRKGDKTVKALAAKLDDAAPSVRAAAALSLGELKATDRRTAVQGLLDDKDVLVRRQAVRALGAMGEPAARPALEAKLKDDDTMVRSFAVESLGALGDGAATKAVEAALADPQADVRRAGAEALMHLRAAESGQALIKLLDDPDDRVRWMAALAVGRMGSRSLLPELRRRRDKAEGDLREQLDQAVRAIEDRSRPLNAPAASGPR